MFRVKELREYELFSALHGCSVSVAHRLEMDGMESVLELIDKIANHKLFRDLEDQEELIFANLKCHLKQIDPEKHIPVKEVGDLQDICEELRAARKGISYCSSYH